jgi:hypothetical protein
MTMKMPDLPNDIIMEIMKLRKQAMYLDKLEKDQRKHNNNLLQEISFQVEDLQLCIERIYDDCNNYDEDTESYDSDELEAIENTPYSLLLLENINNYNYFEKLYGTKLEEDY